MRQAHLQRRRTLTIHGYRWAVLALALAFLVPAGASGHPAGGTITVTRYVDISFSGSYTFEGKGELQNVTGPSVGITTKAVFKGAFKRVPVVFRFSGDQVEVNAYPDRQKANGTITGRWTISSGGRAPARYGCDVPWTSYSTPAFGEVFGSATYLKGRPPPKNYDFFPGTTRYAFGIGAISTRRDSFLSDLGMPCAFAPGASMGRFRSLAARLVRDVGGASVYAQWYLTRRQTLKSLSYPLSNIYRGQPLRPLDLRGSTDLVAANMPSGTTKFTSVNLRFRVTPG